ncbi:MAG: hypothetical protein MHM6MM_004820 [Cercozoa sp. M6MM]
MPQDPDVGRALKLRSSSLRRLSDNPSTCLSLPSEASLSESNLLPTKELSNEHFLNVTRALAPFRESDKVALSFNQSSSSVGLPWLKLNTMPLKTQRSAGPSSQLAFTRVRWPTAVDETLRGLEADNTAQVARELTQRVLQGVGVLNESEDYEATQFRLHAPQPEALRPPTPPAASQWYLDECGSEEVRTFLTQLDCDPLHRRSSFELESENSNRRLRMLNSEVLDGKCVRYVSQQALFEDVLQHEVLPLPHRIQLDRILALTALSDCTDFSSVTTTATSVTSEFEEDNQSLAFTQILVDNEHFVALVCDFWYLMCTLYAEGDFSAQCWDAMFSRMAKHYVALVLHLRMEIEKRVPACKKTCRRNYTALLVRTVPRLWAQTVFYSLCVGCPYSAHCELDPRRKLNLLQVVFKDDLAQLALELATLWTSGLAPVKEIDAVLSTWLSQKELALLQKEEYSETMFERAAELIKQKRPHVRMRKAFVGKRVPCSVRSVPYGQPSSLLLTRFMLDNKWELDYARSLKSHVRFAMPLSVSTSEAMRKLNFLGDKVNTDARRSFDAAGREQCQRRLGDIAAEIHASCDSLIRRKLADNMRDRNDPQRHSESRSDLQVLRTLNRRNEQVTQQCQQEVARRCVTQEDTQMSDYLLRLMTAERLRHESARKREQLARDTAFEPVVASAVSAKLERRLQQVRAEKAHSLSLKVHLHTHLPTEELLARTINLRKEAKEGEKQRIETVQVAEQLLGLATAPTVGHGDSLSLAVETSTFATEG